MSVKGSNRRRAAALVLGAGAATLSPQAAGAANPGCESMTKGATVKIEVCAFWETTASGIGDKVSNYRFQVRNGYGGGYLELRPVATKSAPRTDTVTRTFSGVGYSLSTSATRTTSVCWATIGYEMFDRRLWAPCGTLYLGTHLTFEAVRYDASYKEIDRLTHK